MALCLVVGAAAFNAPAMRPCVGVERAASPAMQFSNPFAKKDTEQLPPGWKKVPSRSRPGEFSYENIKTGQVYNRIPNQGRGGGGDFFDDEKDTTQKPLWQWNQQEKDEEFGGYRSAQEQAGFAANGEDLSTVGGIVYVAFIPFLLFFLVYVFGGIGTPYGGGGNFR